MLAYNVIMSSADCGEKIGRMPWPGGSVEGTGESDLSAFL
jgi:hypothetical protein